MFGKKKKAVAPPPKASSSSSRMPTCSSSDMHHSLSDRRDDMQSVALDESEESSLVGLDGEEELAPKAEYTHLDVTTTPSHMDDEGKFTGETLAEYQAVAAELKEASPDGKDPRDQDVRFEMLKRRITTASAGRAEREAALREDQPDAKVMGMFTAPEWFMSRPGDAYSPEELEEIEAKFTGLSGEKGNEDMLMIPGSSLWREEGSGPFYDRQKARRGNKASAYFGGEQVHSQQKWLNAGDTQGYGASSNETHMHPSHGGKSAENTKMSAIDKPNREYGRARGKRVEGKEGIDAGRVEGESTHFDAGGRRFALEVCADHGSARAAGDFLGGETDGVDVQAVISHGADLKPERMQPGPLGAKVNPAAVMRDGGIGVHNDGNAGRAAVLSATGEHTARPFAQTVADKRETIATGELPMKPGDAEILDQASAFERRMLTMQADTLKGQGGANGHMGTYELPPPRASRLG